MRVILDENMPRPLLGHLTGHEFSTVQDEDWAGMSNGELIAALNGEWDVFVTADQNLRYQQNLAGRSLAIVELSTNRWPVVLTLVDAIQAAIDGATEGSYTTVP